MNNKRHADAIPVVHTHCFEVVNPFQPEADRCTECGIRRFEVMGPFARHKARLGAYKTVGVALETRQ